MWQPRQLCLPVYCHQPQLPVCNITPTMCTQLVLIFLKNYNHVNMYFWCTLKGFTGHGLGITRTEAYKRSRHMSHRGVPWMLRMAACQASSFSLLLYSLQPPLAQALVATYGWWLDNQTVWGSIMREMWRSQSMRHLSVALVQHKKKTTQSSLFNLHCIYIKQNFAITPTHHQHIRLAQMWHNIHHVSIWRKFNLKNLYFRTFNSFTISI